MEPVIVAPENTSVDNANDSADEESTTQTRGRRWDAGATRSTKTEKGGSATEKAALILHEDVVQPSKSCCRLSATSPWFRFAMLSMLATSVFSGYFSYDLPGITADELKTNMKKDNSDLGAVFAVYALPNAIIPLFSGILFTRVGVWPGVIVISITKAIGVAIMAMSVAANSFSSLVVGRIIYGVVGESLYVGVDILTTEWFAEKELGLAYGLIQAAGQLGSFAAFYGAPFIMQRFGHYKYAYYIGAIIAVISVGSMIFAVYAEKHLRLRDLRPRRDSAEEGEEADGSSTRDEADVVEVASLGSPSAGQSPSAWCTGRWARTLGLHYLSSLPIEFWEVLCAIAVYSAVFYTFLAFGNDYLMSNFQLNMEESGRLVGIVSLASAVLSPASGYAMDRFGGRPYVAWLGMLLSFMGFMMLAVFPVIGIHISISFAAVGYALLPPSLYSMIADTVPPHAFTQVYALVNASINVVLVVAFYSTGWITNTIISEGEELLATDFPDYQPVFYIFLILLGIGSICTIDLSRRHLFSASISSLGIRRQASSENVEMVTVRQRRRSGASEACAQVRQRIVSTSPHSTSTSEGRSRKSTRRVSPQGRVSPVDQRPRGGSLDSAASTSDHENTTGASRILRPSTPPSTGVVARGQSK